YCRQQYILDTCIYSTLQNFRPIILKLFKIKVTVRINQNKMVLLGMVFNKSTHRITDISTRFHSVFIQNTINNVTMTCGNGANKPNFILIGISILHDNAADKIFKSLIQHILNIWMIIMLTQERAVRSYKPTFLIPVVQLGIDVFNIHIIIFFKIFLELTGQLIEVIIINQLLAKIAGTSFIAQNKGQRWSMLYDLCPIIKARIRARSQNTCNTWLVKKTGACRPKQVMIYNTAGLGKAFSKHALHLIFLSFAIASGPVKKYFGYNDLS